MSTNYHLNGIRFVPQGVVQSDLKEGVALRIEFTSRSDNPVIECVITPSGSYNAPVYELTAVHFVQDGRSPYSMSEIYLLVTSVAQYSPQSQRILKAIYNSYLNA